MGLAKRLKLGRALFFTLLDDDVSRAFWQHSVGKQIFSAPPACLAITVGAHSEQGGCGRLMGFAAYSGVLRGCTPERAPLPGLALSRLQEAVQCAKESADTCAAARQLLPSGILYLGR